MANVNGTGTVFNTNNYAGELFTADPINAPFLSAIGGLTKGGKVTDNFEFATGSQYGFPSATQPAISETASLTAPTAITYQRDQSTNVVQTYQEKVSLSYDKIANTGRLSGLNSAGQQNNVVSELDFQKATALKKIARDIEYTCLNGVYQKATDSNTANKSRGMISLCSTLNTVTASGASNSKDLMDSLFRMMYTNGASFENIVIWVNAYQKQILSSIYGYAPADRNVGGINIKQIETDFGTFGIALNRFIPADTLLVAEMSAIAPVTMNIPDKGNFFYEELAKTGAAEEGQIFGKFGLDHGMSFLHGTVTGLKAS